MQIRSILRYALQLFRHEMLRSFPAKIFFTLVALTALQISQIIAGLQHFLESKKLSAVRFKLESQKFRKLYMLKFIFSVSNPNKGFSFFQCLIYCANSSFCY